MIAICEAIGPLHDILCIDLLLDHQRLSIRAVYGLALVVKLWHLDTERFDERRRVIRFEVLDNALRDEEDRKNQTDWEQEVIADPRDIDPEVAQSRRRVPRDAPHQDRGDGDTDRRGEVVMKRETKHLRQVRHRGFATIALPIGVRGETRRGIERQMLAERGHLLRV